MESRQLNFGGETTAAQQGVNNKGNFYNAGSWCSLALKEGENP
jgi:hypothetical protein